TNNRYIFENKGTNSLSTNALIAGGLSRFIQHAPINIKKDADKLARLTQDVIFRNQYLKRIEFQESMTYAIPRTSDEIFSDMQRTKNPERKLANFEYTSIKFTDTKTELKTAWANIVVSYSIINKTPIVMFIAESDIQSGEQILVSYGLGNLIGQEIYPELFKLDGSVVLHDLYYRDKILVTCTIQNNNQNLIYQRDTFLKYDIQRDSPTPIAVFPGQYPFSSTFFLRKELVRANALTEEYKALPAPSAVIHLQRIFGDLDIKVECFYRDPKMNADPNHALNQVVDIVLSAKNRITWTYLYLLFENIKFHCKRFEHTNEVIILGANTVPSELMTFISLLLKLRRSIHFNETPVIPEKRPDDIHIISYFFQQQGRPKTPDTFNEACMCGDYKISFQ
ncbi:MAG: hypothetical protein JSS53_00240, partial [Proteobacteria bacterium]|nr:hypothetical protein [Pseudomonadota bacterium]